MMNIIINIIIMLLNNYNKMEPTYRIRSDIDPFKFGKWNCFRNIVFFSEY